MNKIKPITPDDTASIFIGSAALDYPWYRRVSTTGVDLVNGSAEDWRADFEHFDPDTGETVSVCTLNHKVLMAAVRTIADGKVPELKPGESVAVRECRTLIFEGADECDFDAASADNVIQFAAFGEVIYG